MPERTCETCKHHNGSEGAVSFEQCYTCDLCECSNWQPKDKEASRE
jgi:hypothetical protein